MTTENQTPAAPAYPAAFAGCNIDDSNYKLRMGYASEADAKQLVAWWNTSGKRLSVATLGYRSAFLGGRTEVIVPYITLR